MKNIKHLVILLGAIVILLSSCGEIINSVTPVIKIYYPEFTQREQQVLCIITDKNDAHIIDTIEAMHIGLNNPPDNIYYLSIDVSMLCREMDYKNNCPNIIVIPVNTLYRDTISEIIMEKVNKDKPQKTEGYKVKSFKLNGVSHIGTEAHSTGRIN